ncbi:hypothetical protein Ciccas_014193, partial [Cichlidogyrus casuarinus]
TIVQCLSAGSSVHGTMATLKNAFSLFEAYKVDDLLPLDLQKEIGSCFQEFQLLISSSSTTPETQSSPQLHQEVRQLASQLDKINMFLLSSGVDLGDQLDKENILTQLKQFALELQARRPQLDKLLASNSGIREDGQSLSPLTDVNVVQHKKCVDPSAFRYNSCQT